MGSIPLPVAPPVTTMWTQRASSVLGAPSAQVTFSGLSDRAYRLTANYAPTAALTARVTCNNDSGANYGQQWVYAFAAANTAARTSGNGYWQAGNAATVAADLAAGMQYVIQKPLAAQHAHMVSIDPRHTTAGNNQDAAFGSGRWANTANLITRVDVLTSTSTFKTGSVFTVEGIA